MTVLVKMSRRFSLLATGGLLLMLACCSCSTVVSAGDIQTGDSRTVSSTTPRNLRQRNTSTNMKRIDSSNAANPHSSRQRQLDSVSYCVEEEDVLERCIGRVSIEEKYDCKACVVTAYLGAGLCDEVTTEATCRELQACDRRCRGCDIEVQRWAACEIDVVRGVSPPSQEDSSSCPSFVCPLIPPRLPTPSPTNPAPTEDVDVEGRVDYSNVLIDSTLVIAPNPPAPTLPPFVDMTGSMLDETTSPSPLVVAPNPPAPTLPPFVEMTGSMVDDTPSPSSVSVPATTPSLAPTVPRLPTDVPVPVTLPSIAPTTVPTDAPTAIAPGVPAMDSTDDGDANLQPTLPPAFTTVLVGTAECEGVEMGLKQCLVGGFMMSDVQADFCARCILTASSTPQVTDSTLTCDESNQAACSGYTGCSTCAFPDFVCWNQMVAYGSCEAESLRQTTQQIECPFVNTTCPFQM